MKFTKFLQLTSTYHVVSEDQTNAKLTFNSTVSRLTYGRVALINNRTVHLYTPRIQ